MTISTIDQHEKAFKNVSAYVIIKNGVCLARINIKHGVAVQAFITTKHSKYYKGKASGGGYDKKMASIADAASKLKADNDTLTIDEYKILDSIVNGYNNGLSIYQSLPDDFTVINAI